MIGQPRWASFRQLIPLGLILALIAARPVWAGQDKSSSASTEKEHKSGPVVRTYGASGGYRTEVRSETKGTLGEEDRRQVAVLTAQIFQHIDEARQAIDADEEKRAGEEVEKGRQALRAIRGLLPKISVETKTTAADGKVVYEDKREIQEDRVPLFEGMLHEQTLAPVIEAKRNSVETAGVRVVKSETINTEAVADLGVVESQLTKAAKALEKGKTETAAKALAEAQVRGVEFFYSKEDTPLAEARDALWLARRSLEENNAAQARVNLNVARERLRLYRQVAPEERRSEIDRMLQDAERLENQLRQENVQTGRVGDRSRQGNAVTRWWEQVNTWFKRHF